MSAPLCEVDEDARLPLGSTHCLCGLALLPLGATAEHRVFGKVVVAGWGQQDHWHVPVRFADGEHGYVSRNDLAVRS